MSESDTTSTTEAAISGDAGFEALVDDANKRQREQEQEVSAAARKKRRLLEAKRHREESAPPVTVTLTDPDNEDLELRPELCGEEFIFDPISSEHKSFLEDVVLEFAGADPDGQDLPPAQARKMKEAKERLLQILVEYTADAYDESFWTEMTDYTDRQIIVGDAIAEQGK